MADVRTNAWDLLATIRQVTLNEQFAALYNKGKLLHGYKEDIELPFVGKATVDATLGPPKVKVDTAVLNLVQVSFPLTGGTITSKMGTIPIPASGLTVTVVTDLQYVHLQLGDQKQVLRLAVNFTSPNAVYNVVMDGHPPGWDPDYNAVLSSALCKKLKEDAGTHDYDHPYHLGDLVLPPGIPEGLQPTGQADFAAQVVQKADPGDNNIIALLMTTAGDQPGISNVFSNLPALIPDGHVSSLIISNQVLLKKLVVPAMAASIKCGAGDFSYSGSRTTPMTANLTTHPYLGGTYSIYMWNVSIRVADNNTIVVDYESHAHPLVDTKETFYIKVTGNITLAPQVQTDKEGHQQIVFSGSHSDPSGSVECEWWVYPIVVAAILLTFGTLSLLFAAIVAIVIPILMATLTFPVDMPTDLKTKTNQGVASFQWPLQDVYPLDGVTLPGDLILTGVPKFA